MLNCHVSPEPSFPLATPGRLILLRILFVLGRHLGLVTVEDWGEKVFAEGVGVSGKMGNGL